MLFSSENPPILGRDGTLPQTYCISIMSKTYGRLSSSAEQPTLSSLARLPASLRQRAGTFA